MYVKIVGSTVILPTGGGKRAGIPKRHPNIVAHLTEESPPAFREVAVSRDGRGDYYCSFVYEQSEEMTVREGRIVAFDLGIKTLAVGVTDKGRYYHNANATNNATVCIKHRI